ncbi:unnamed protein product [Camellia sinensis]
MRLHKKMINSLEWVKKNGGEIKVSGNDGAAPEAFSLPTKIDLEPRRI